MFCNPKPNPAPSELPLWSIAVPCELPLWCLVVPHLLRCFNSRLSVTLNWILSCFITVCYRPSCLLSHDEIEIVYVKWFWLSVDKTNAAAGFRRYSFATKPWKRAKTRGQLIMPTVSIVSRWSWSTSAATFHARWRFCFCIEMTNHVWKTFQNKRRKCGDWMSIKFSFLVTFVISFKICHQVAGYTMSVYNMQLRNIGRAKCIVCPTNPTFFRTTALPAHYVPAPLCLARNHFIASCVEALQHVGVCWNFCHIFLFNFML